MFRFPLRTTRPDATPPDGPPGPDGRNSGSITLRRGRRPRRPRRRAPRDARLVGRSATVLDAWGDFGHAVVDGQVWIIRHPTDVLHTGQRVRVVEQHADMLLVLPAPFADDDQPIVGC